MTTGRLSYLLEQRHKGSLTENERNELELWYKETQDNNFMLFDGNDKEEEEQYKSEMYKLLMGRIAQQDFPQRSKKIFQIYRWTVAAAVILAATTVFFIQKNTTDKSGVQSVAVQTLASGGSIQVLKNSTQDAIACYLSDSTKVILSANSGFSYDTCFPGNRREIHVFGKAFFKVTKNANKPFIVYCNNVSVTVLGTSFTVSDMGKDSVVKVALHHGKVVVNSVDSSSRGKSAPVYLLPGDCISVRAGEPPVFIKKRPDVKQKMNSKISDSISFNQKPLEEALDIMAVHFRKQIIYNEEDVINLEFSGVIHSNDSLESLLQRIAVLNGLIMEKIPEGFRIGKN